MNIVDRLAGLVLYNAYLLAVLLVCLRSMWRRSWLRGAVAAERGQGLVEYALILVLVAVVVIGVLLVLGPSIKGLF